MVCPIRFGLRPGHSGSFYVSPNLEAMPGGGRQVQHAVDVNLWQRPTFTSGQMISTCAECKNRLALQGSKVHAYSYLFLQECMRGEAERLPGSLWTLGSGLDLLVSTVS